MANENGVGPPSLLASEKAIKKVVLETAAGHSLTLYPMAVAALGVFGFCLLGGPICIGMMIGGFAIGGSSFAANYFFREKTIAGQYLTAMRAEAENRRHKMLETVAAELNKDWPGEELDPVAEQGAEQFEELQKKIEDCRKILEAKLNIGELTFNRYLGLLEQIYLSVLENLQATLNLLKGIQSIDINDIRIRLSELKRKRDKDDGDKSAIKIFEEKLELWNGQIKKAKALLLNNEKAMTEMDKTMAVIAEMETGRSDDSSGKLNIAMEQLEELAKAFGKKNAEKNF